MSPALERPPLAAGEFYPADPAELTRALSELFAGVKRLRLSRPPLLLVTPHSALEKSGAVAAAAFAHLLGQKYDAVVIIAPSHTGHFPGVSVYDGERYRTPLGELPVERALASEIAQLTPAVKLSSRGHA
ncbi:MAG TPA: AmmeMemoRadiSam system protein B, partial [candidate division Zixibacteria bacterium]|nr:AmmeMemoRadiSam system protein B [candidate division Zixibacteria bacterium]